MALTFTEVTNGDPAGSGSFDTIMKSISAHLEREYLANRIRDDDYATVYLGSLQAALAQSVQFTISKEQMLQSFEMNEEQKALIRQQILTEKGQVEDVAFGIIGLQQDNLAKELALKDKELLERDSRKALIDQQILTEKGSVEDITTGLIGLQQAALTKDNLLKDSQKAMVDQQIISEQGQTQNITTGLIGLQQTVASKQIDKLVQDTNLVAQQVVTETANTADATAGTAGKQQAKLQSEIDLITQKKISEEAQTTDIAGGIIGKQQALYEAQKDGFKRDAEQKLAKIFTDAFSVQRSTDSAFSPTGTGLENANIQAVLNKAKQGIGL